MTQLPTNRTAANTVAEHTSDHNTLCAQHNELDGHAADTTSVHGIADTSVLATDAEVATAVADHAAAANPHAGYATDGDLSGHAADTTAIHGIADTAALETTSGSSAKVAAHEADASAAHAASAVAFTPTGTIAATDVQAALAEVDSEKAATGHAHSGTYVPLPAGAPTSASQILGLSDDDPLTTAWVDPPAGGGAASDSDQNILANRMFG